MRLYCIFVFALTTAVAACAVDDAEPAARAATQDTVAESPERAELPADDAEPTELLTCRRFNTGAWGCHTDEWCDYKCKAGADGSSPFGWRDHCEWHIGHWETVCECCSL